MKQLSRVVVLPALLGLLLIATLSANPVPPTSGYNPPLRPASDEAQKAIARFALNSKLTVSVWAAEPMLAHPVALAIDEKGQIYVAETFRHSDGVTDNRSHMNWLDDELACRTVEERVAVYRKFSKNFAKEYESHRDRVRMLVDTDGDGKADRSTVFADDFGKAEDGIGAGLLARNGDVWFTCIPHLWKLRDSKGNGVADSAEKVSSGYGVHVAFIGHDLHGLRIGPDQRLYFTIGDRGLNVVNKEGQRLFFPDGGAVLRCELDGSNLELVHVGLRNPQELAFDNFGNLFTVDNNSDSGDQARWICIAPGADSGWRIGYQYGSELHDEAKKLGNRGPWNFELLWKPHFPGQAAYILPPLKNYSAGPSGLTHYPGLGLSERYQDHFFLCDFRGDSGNSGITAFAAKPKGASFEMIDEHKFIWSILATDADFGPDGNLYIADWIEGWSKSGKGRIYKVSDPEAQKNPQIAEVKKLLAEGFAKRSTAELTALLAHPHQQVRMEASFALAAQGEIEAFGQVLNSSAPLLAKLHSLWGLGIVLRKMPEKGTRGLVTQALASTEAEVRAQAARTLAEYRGADRAELVKVLTPYLRDESARVRYFAALSIGKLAEPTNVPLTALGVLLHEVGDKDLYLRHAGIMGLTAAAPKSLVEFGLRNPSPAVRLAVVVALRKQNAPEIAAFLNDPEVLVVTEAVRAIHDEEITAAYPQAAAMLKGNKIPEEVGSRLLNICFCLGGLVQALEVGAYAVKPLEPQGSRLLAVKMLGDWAKPGRRDYITGLTQNLSNRDPNAGRHALTAVLAGLVTGDEKVRQETFKAAAKLGIREIGPTLLGVIRDAKQPSTLRMEALNALAALKDRQIEAALTVALDSTDAVLRTAGLDLLAERKPTEAVAKIQDVLAGNDIVAKQGAFAILSKRLRNEPIASEAVLSAWAALEAGKLPPELTLDLLEASKAVGGTAAQNASVWQSKKPKDDVLAPYREAIVGGNAERGRKLVLNRAELQCQRCHKIDGYGGEVGPELDGIGSKHPREYLLESIVAPNKQIAKGFETVVLDLASGKSVSGILKMETATELHLVTPEGNPVTIRKSEIEDRRAGQSAMPADLLKHLSPLELRDVVEYLASMKQKP